MIPAVYVLQCTTLGAYHPFVFATLYSFLRPAVCAAV